MPFKFQILTYNYVSSYHEVKKFIIPFTAFGFQTPAAKSNQANNAGSAGIINLSWQKNNLGMAGLPNMLQSK